MVLEILAWIVILVIAIVVEAMTAGLVSIWFVPGALVAIVLSICHVPLWIQVVVCCILAVLCVILTQTVFRKYILQRKKLLKTNIDAIIGETGMVTEAIDNLRGCGAVKVKGLEWSARSVSEDITFAEGTYVTIVAIEGVKLICKSK